MQTAIMSLGDNLAHPLSNAQHSEASRHRQLVDYAVWAAEAGFDAVHIGEHHFNDYILSSPQIVLAAIGERTPDLILSTAVTLVPTLDPVRMAEDYATLDALSGGRVEIVAGRGNFFSRTYPAFGLKIADAREIFDEKVTLLRQLLDEENVTWSGKHRDPLNSITTRPRPTRSMPMWIGAGSPRSAELAARLGCHLMLPSVFGHPKMFVPIVEQYREQWETYGHDPSDLKIGSCCHAFVGTDRSDMLARFVPRYEHYWNFVDELIQANSDGKVQLPFDLEASLAGPAVAGSAQECVDRMGEIYDLFGHDRQLFMFDMGGISNAELQETVLRFGEEVIPHLPG
jgi:alkanesulfonate monooxygenase SsuD/methylene tetrahydromethanopterin reductase-like flavin-dependent oxidoreductase (luciferase family)